jgi:hypothetical protein
VQFALHLARINLVVTEDRLEAINERNYVELLVVLAVDKDSLFSLAGAGAIDELSGEINVVLFGHVSRLSVEADPQRRASLRIFAAHKVSKLLIPVFPMSFEVFVTAAECALLAGDVVSVDPDAQISQFGGSRRECAASLNDQVRFDRDRSLVSVLPQSPVPDRVSQCVWSSTQGQKFCCDSQRSLIEATPARVNVIEMENHDGSIEWPRVNEVLGKGCLSGTARTVDEERD